MNYSSEDIIKLEGLIRLLKLKTEHEAYIENEKKNVNPYIEKIESLRAELIQATKDSIAFDEDRDHTIHSITNFLSELDEKITKLGINGDKLRKSLGHTEDFLEVSYKEDNKKSTPVTGVMGSYSIFRPPTEHEKGAMMSFKTNIVSKEELGSRVYSENTVFGIDRESRTLYIFSKKEYAILFIMYWIFQVRLNITELDGPIVRNGVIFTTYTSLLLLLKSAYNEELGHECRQLFTSDVFPERPNRFSWYRSTYIIDTHYNRVIEIVKQ